MNKKIVLVVDDDRHRAEKLLFIVRLGGYETRTFSSTAEAWNWIKYGCSAGDVLCLLFNNPGDFNCAEEIVATWTAAGMILSVVLLQRGRGNWNRLLAIGENDHFFVCEPESVMQTLEILTAITANNPRVNWNAPAERLSSGGMLFNAGKEGGCRRSSEVVLARGFDPGDESGSGGEILDAFRECDTLTVHLEGVKFLDFSSLVLLCAVKRQANEKGKVLVLAGLGNPLVAAVVQRYRRNGSRLCRAYCGQSCLFEAEIQA